VVGVQGTDRRIQNAAVYSKLLMWLVYREQIGGYKILHGGNGRQYRLPDVLNLSVD
jgi:hypothetical protein